MSLAVKPQHRQAPVPILKVGCGPPTLALNRGVDLYWLPNHPVKQEVRYSDWGRPGTEL